MSAKATTSPAKGQPVELTAANLERVLRFCMERGDFKLHAFYTGGGVLVEVTLRKEKDSLVGVHVDKRGIPSFTVEMTGQPLPIRYVVGRTEYLPFFINWYSTVSRMIGQEENQQMCDTFSEIPSKSIFEAGPTDPPLTIKKKEAFVA
jgi:hypothetical protein